MRKSNVKLGFGLAICILVLLAGLALIGAAFLWTPLANSQWKMKAIIAGAVVAVIFLILSLVLAGKLNKPAPKKNVKSQKEQEMEIAQDRINYIPSNNVFDFVTMGNTQSAEEKFGQIAQMDRTQFVIYIAKLFSLRGYQVRLTTVVDNRNIDMLVEKRGITIAVGCIKADKVLSSKEIAPVLEGLRYYNAHSAMALTNTYFDRSALEFAKAQGMSLVDRTILVEDFF